MWNLCEVERSSDFWGDNLAFEKVNLEPRREFYLTRANSFNNMLTNRYRVTTNGFRYRVERLEVEIKTRYVPARELVDMVGLGYGLRWLLVAVLAAQRVSISDWARTTWAQGYYYRKEHDKERGRPFISWITEFPQNLTAATDYTLIELPSAFEAYQFIKKLDPEAEVLSPEFKAIS